MKHTGTIGYEVRTLNNMLYRRFLCYESGKGMDELTVMHGWIIGFLYDNRHRDIFQKDIEAEYSIAKSTTTEILKLMEKKGYIRREPAEQDKRLKRLTLTEKGIQMHLDTVKDIDFLEEGVKRHISREDLEVFFSVVHRMKENIENQEF